MAERIKYLGGIGYILVLVGIIAAFAKFGGVITLIGVILAGIAWILLGRRLHDKVMIGNGILMIISLFLIPLIIIAMLFAMFPQFMGVSQQRPSTIMPEQMMQMISMLVTVILVAVAIGFASWILHVISHFRAGNKLAISTFKYSAYCQIASFVISIASLAWLFGNIVKLAPLLQQMVKPDITLLSSILGPVFIIFMVAGVIGIIAYILSIIAFFSVEEV